MVETIRTFVAIDLDQGQRRVLAELQRQLKGDRSARIVRWVDPENVHLTLKFLGDVESSRMPAVEHALREACRGTAPFTLRLAGAGAFPNSRRPNVIWVGLEGEVGSAAALAKRIDDACASLDFPPEARAFAAHLTLGRVKRDAPPADRQSLGALIDRAQVGPAEALRVEQVNLMKSELRPGGSVYTRLAQVQLAQTA